MEGLLPLFFRWPFYVQSVVVIPDIMVFRMCEEPVSARALDFILMDADRVHAKTLNASTSIAFHVRHNVPDFKAQPTAVLQRFA